mgnify:CR=1 FL=1
MLTDAYESFILICMRTTLNMDEELYKEAVKATGVTEKTQLIHMGLKALIQEAAYKRLAKLHGAIPEAKAPPRRRFK